MRISNTRMIAFLCLVVVVLCAFTIGCSHKEELSSEFSYMIDEPTSGFWLDYKSDKKEFKVDNVVLEVYFGWHHPTNFDTKYDSLDFELVARKDDGQDEYVVASIPGFNSIKYHCDFSSGKKIAYKHSETIIIPEELFDSESGKIWLILKGFVSDGYYPGGGYNSFIYTKMGDGLVRLDSK